jgi:hypothetical protein
VVREISSDPTLACLNVSCLLFFLWSKKKEHEFVVSVGTMHKLRSGFELIIAWNYFTTSHLENHFYRQFLTKSWWNRIQLFLKGTDWLNNFNVRIKIYLESSWHDSTSPKERPNQRVKLQEI